MPEFRAERTDLRDCQLGDAYIYIYIGARSRARSREAPAIELEPAAPARAARAALRAFPLITGGQ